MTQTELFNDLRYHTDYKKVGRDLDYFVEVLHDDKKIRVKFQESHSVTDWILNFVFPIIPVLIHGKLYNIAIGWWLSWYSGREIVLHEIYTAIAENPDYEIEICGYSFGGAISQICGIELYERLKIKSTLITFGSPRPLFGLCALWAKRCFKSVTQYAYWNDIVTWCPPIFLYFTVKNKRIGKFNLKELFHPTESHQAYEREELY